MEPGHLLHTHVVLFLRGFRFRLATTCPLAGGGGGLFRICARAATL